MVFLQPGNQLGAKSPWCSLITVCFHSGSHLSTDAELLSLLFCSGSSCGMDDHPRSWEAHCVQSWFHNFAQSCLMSRLPNLFLLSTFQEKQASLLSLLQDREFTTTRIQWECSPHHLCQQCPGNSSCTVHSVFRGWEDNCFLTNMDRLNTPWPVLGPSAPCLLYFEQHE